MSFQKNNIEHIKVKKSNISNSNLMSTTYIGIDIMKAREIALLGIVNKYTITPIKNILIKGEKLKKSYLIRMPSKQTEIRI